MRSIDGDGFTRLIEFPSPSTDRRDDDGGIKDVLMRVALIGPEGAVSWDLYTGWFTRALRDEHRERGAHVGPNAGAVYSHFKPGTEPEYLDRESGECDLLPCGKCLGDAGFLNGDTVFDAFTAGGETGLWDAMRGMYESMVKGEYRG